MRAAPRLRFLALFVLLFPAASQAQSDVKQGVQPVGRIVEDPKDPLKGWSPFWSRVANEGRALVDVSASRDGRPSIRIEHKGARDWSLGRQTLESVSTGQVFRFSAWVKVAEKSRAVLSVVLRDAQGGTIDWSYGEAVATAPEWTLVESRFMIPRGAVTMQPRVIGDGPATAWLCQPSLTLDPESIAIASSLDGRKLVLADARLRVDVDPATAAFRLRDLRSGREWTQKPHGSTLMVTGAGAKADEVSLDLVDPRTILKLRATLRLDPSRPELIVELTGDGPLSASIGFPYPFATETGSTLILPVNEGMSYPVDDPALPAMQYILYGGHGLCMAWWGVVDGPKGLMAIVETPDDASIRVPRVDGRLCLAPLWDPQKNAFGPSRRLRYVAIDDGGYVAMAKRYREYAKSIGLLKTLAEKRAANPNIDKLVGAVNVWCWDRHPASIVREMKDAGIDRILWSNAAAPDQLKQMNEMGVLTSRYDIYQDVMDPATFPKLQYTHSDWPTKAWPADLMIDARGDWIRGWEIEGKDGGMYPCGVTCDRQAPAYAIERIGKELANHPYGSRFIDTTTAAPWRECYSTQHPATRSESRKFKVDLLDVVHGRFNLVTGSETGHDAAVPFVDYFEGMLSLGPYRVDDAGRNMIQVVEKVPPQIEKFQVGAYYRLPLWELVYHDCVVAQWYWGDYNNKLPAVWDRRDLFNALYGTPPMFMFTAESWRQDRDRFVKSYQTAARVARDAGYSEMVGHEWLSKDHSVQRTRFANGESVLVNFGDRPHRTPEGAAIPPLGIQVQAAGSSR
ncbi:glycoside hydrolase [Paludisphaera mucosa]|uniref:Glycoside hydrolase n=1 Tax=Paludisphaera mucosa TaxID=3030827 RepID=A0ABT6F7J4_9BACT|nr:glycoside hydrolase [Paludisphaera mucosa]MDG3003543.1 glycoside hydrolase [Paludisphaera mucosa]